LELCLDKIHVETKNNTEKKNCTGLLEIIQFEESSKSPLLEKNSKPQFNS